jgi:hypothetical protein
MKQKIIQYRIDNHAYKNQEIFLICYAQMTHSTSLIVGIYCFTRFQRCQMRVSLYNLFV